MEPYVGEIRTFAFDRIPVGWMPCEGQTLPVQSYQALYALIGVTYGGKTNVNFQLPDLRSRVTMNKGLSTVKNSQNYYAVTDKGGTETVTLTAAQVPSHAHTVNVFNGNANAQLGSGVTIAQKQQTQALINENIQAFIEPPKPPVTTLVPLHPSAVATVGGAPHENRMPYTGLQVCIAISGYFPTRP